MRDRVLGQKNPSFYVPSSEPFSIAFIVSLFFLCLTTLQLPTTVCTVLNVWMRVRGGSTYGLNLTFMCPCIANVFSSITNEMQCYTIYLFLRNAPHVSCGSSTHHQELKNCMCVCAAWGTLSNLYCCLPPWWKRWKSSISSTTVMGGSKGLTKYPMLYIQFLSS